MKTIHYSTKAKKDLKKYRNNIRLMEALYEVLSSLVKGEAVPEKYKPMNLQEIIKAAWNVMSEMIFF